ncbi:MAG: peptidylprolyl isomerase [Candidatus Aureabacteria bacterium]|nr:peptidylprolyl isomerase [Candidatus Auribacterota bacterium]
MNRVYFHFLQLVLPFVLSCPMTAFSQENNPENPAGSGRTQELVLNPQTVLASVNGKEIVFREISEQYHKGLEDMNRQEIDPSPVMQKFLLLRLIHEKIEEILFLEESEKRAVLVSQDEFQKAFSHVREKFREEADYQSFLKKNEISDEKLKERILDRLKVKNLQDQLLKDVAPVSDQDVESFYEEHQNEIYPPEGYHLSQILLYFPEHPSEMARKEIRNKMDHIRKDILLKKADFERMARLYSQGYSAPSGGLIGWIGNSSSIDPVLYEEVKKIKPGEISSVVSTEQAAHLLKLNEYRPPSSRDNEMEVKETIRKDLVKARKMEVLRQFLEGCSKNADIKIFVTLPQSEK